MKRWVRVTFWIGGSILWIPVLAIAVCLAWDRYVYWHDIALVRQISKERLQRAVADALTANDERPVIQDPTVPIEIHWRQPTAGTVFEDMGARYLQWSPGNVTLHFYDSIEDQVLLEISGRRRTATLIYEDGDKWKEELLWGSKSMRAPMASARP